MASALSTFTDFVNVTGPSFLTSAMSVVNEAVKSKYLLRRFLKGKAPDEVIQGGSTIKDTLLLDEQSSAEFYLPNATFTWENPQVLSEWEINWRFLADHMSWTDQEVELNTTAGQGRSARHQMYKRLKWTKEQRMWTSILNKIEDQLFAVPEVADMETNTGKQPYSLPAFVNAQTNGLFYGTAGVTGKTVWTAVEGIDPTVDTKWVPATQSYSSSAVNPGGNTNILKAFDAMWLDVRFIAPPTKQEYFEDSALYAQFIACSKAGQKEYVALLRESQDVFVTPGRQDPAFVRPSYAGIDMEYCAILDTVKLYEAETSTDALVTEIENVGVGDANGPRYYWINGNYIKPVFHTNRYMTKHTTMRHPNQPFTSIVPVDCWYNLVCRSRQRNGIVSPAATLDVYTSI